MNRLIDLSGKRFGKLLVSRRGQNIRGQPGWECRCDCGHQYTVLGAHLRSGSTKSCGCTSNQPFEDLTGHTFGRLTVLRRDITKSQHIKWACQCECGNISTPTGGSLRSGVTRSCGCLMAEKARERATKLGEQNRKFSKDEAKERCAGRSREWARSNRGYYRKNNLRNRNDLADFYVRRLLTQRTLLRPSDVPSSAITLKRSILRLKRIIRARSVTA